MIDPVSSRYAEALFGLARARGVLASVRTDLATLARLCADGGPGAFVFDERLPLAARRARLGEHTAALSPLVQDFVQLLFDKRRVEVLRNLHAAFHRRDLSERGAAEGVVESARPLATEDLARLASALGARLGKELALENRVQPSLIGGLRVLVESRMLDASLAGRLEGLRKNLLAAPLPHFES